ncbi:MAG: hypothetical protein VX278_07730, partial [Myxococcota bacterium]|nr:hypothetical protein [Myxococcota bacterium]
IYRDQGTWIVRPIVEINPRHTMGRVALSLGRRCARDALFYLAKKEFSPLVPFTQSQQQFMDGHERITPQNHAFGAFLMVGTDRIEPWLLRNQLWNPHETL